MAARSGSPKAGNGGDDGSVVWRVLNLLQIAAASERPLTLPEINAQLDLPKPTAHRLCMRLAEQGYLAREPGGRHLGIGPRLMSLGLDVVRNGDIGGQRHAILESLVEAVGETCNITMLAGDQVLYLDRVEARWPLRLHLEPGSRVPPHCTSSGKLLLAELSPAKRKRILDTLDLPPFTQRTITDRAKLEAELDVIAGQGYSLDDEEFLLGLVAIAVPVRNAEGRTVAAVACHAPGVRMDVGKALSHLPLLQDAAARIGATIP